MAVCGLGLVAFGGCTKLIGVDDPTLVDPPSEAQDADVDADADAGDFGDASLFGETK